MQSKKSTIILLVCFFIGLSVLLYPSISSYWNSKTQSEAIVDYEAMLAAYKPEDYTAVFEAAEAYNQALFGQFMPSFDQPIQSIDTSRASDGVLEVRHQDGSGTAFYDRTMYQTPRGDYQLLQDTHGGQWYAISGTPSVEQRPVYQDGKPVYDGDKLRTYQVESVRYKTTPTPHKAPDRRSTEPKRRPSKKT